MSNLDLLGAAKHACSDAAARADKLLALSFSAGGALW